MAIHSILLPRGATRCCGHLATLFGDGRRVERVFPHITRVCILEQSRRGPGQWETHIYKPSPSTSLNSAKHLQDLLQRKVHTVFITTQIITPSTRIPLHFHTTPEFLIAELFASRAHHLSLSFSGFHLPFPITSTLSTSCCSSCPSKSRNVLQEGHLRRRQCPFSQQRGQLDDREFQLGQSSQAVIRQRPRGIK